LGNSDGLALGSLHGARLRVPDKIIEGNFDGASDGSLLGVIDGA